MKDYQRKDVVFMCTVAGYLMDESKMDWDHPLLQLQKQKLLTGVLHTTDLMQAIVGQEEFAKLHQQIKDGLYYCDVYTNIEFREYRKKSLKTRRKVDGESIFELAELAMDGQCNNCKKNKKACSLRKALLKAGIPPFSEKRGQCEYLQEGD
jgi:hypothetical protein